MFSVQSQTANGGSIKVVVSRSSLSSRRPNLNCRWGLFLVVKRPIRIAIIARSTALCLSRHFRQGDDRRESATWRGAPKTARIDTVPPYLSNLHHPLSQIKLSPLSVLPLHRLGSVAPRKDKRQQCKRARCSKCDQQSISVQRPHCRLHRRGEIMQRKERFSQFFDELRQHC